MSTIFNLLQVLTTNSSEIHCLTSPHEEATVPVTVVSSGMTFPTVNFTFDDWETPHIDAITPSFGTDGTVVEVTGKFHHFSVGYVQNQVSLTDP